jgi:hypothetical protein
MKTNWRDCTRNAVNFDPPGAGDSNTIDGGPSSAGQRINRPHRNWNLASQLSVTTSSLNPRRVGAVPGSKNLPLARTLFRLGAMLGKKPARVAVTLATKSRRIPSEPLSLFRTSTTLSPLTSCKAGLLDPQYIRLTGSQSSRGLKFSCFWPSWRSWEPGSYTSQPLPPANRDLDSEDFISKSGFKMVHGGAPYNLEVSAHTDLNIHNTVPKCDSKYGGSCMIDRAS